MRCTLIAICCIFFFHIYILKEARNVDLPRWINRKERFCPLKSAPLKRLAMSIINVWYYRKAFAGKLGECPCFLMHTAYCNLRNETERNEIKICILRNENLYFAK